MSETIQISKDYRNLLDTVTENITNMQPDSSNQELWIKMGNELEVCRVPKEQISTIMRKDIEDKIYEKQFKGLIPREDYKWHNNTYWLVTKDHNWINPEMARRLDPNRIKKIVPLTEIEKENYEYITLINDTIDFLRNKALQKLKHNHFMSLIQSKEAKLALHDWRAQLTIAESFFDHKEKVPLNTQHILLHCIATMASNNDAAHEYFKLRDQTHTLTSKQLSKYRKGIVKNRLALYEPRDRNTANMWNYLGIQCINEECKSWRVVELPGTGIIFRAGCLDCENIQTVVQPIKCNTCEILFFKEDIEKLEDKSKCSYCKEEFSPIVIDMIKTF